MPKKILSKERRQTLKEAQKIIKQVYDHNGNEAETRRRVERIFESVMGYDVFKHLSRERAVKGSAETEHVDFAIQLEPGTKAKPLVMVELKRAKAELVRKHLKQVTSYAINAGCEWILLTNGIEWKIYHVEFGQPPEVELLDSWNLLEDDLVEVSEKFDLISYKSIVRNQLNVTWQRVKVFAPEQLLEAIISGSSLSAIRRFLYKNTGIRLKDEEIYAGISKMLNENSAQTLANIKLPSPKKRTRRIKTNNSTEATDKSSELNDNDGQDDPEAENDIS
jgi:hypothetical protein